MNDAVQVLKAWPTYSGEGDWFDCVLVLENGWAPFGHLCSHPNFAPGDLWLGRPERMAAFKKMGIELVLQPITKDMDVPAEVLAKNKDETNWKHFSEQYAALTVEGTADE